jgi:predicted lipid-binding transport protein (Tim44 family)
MLTGFLLGGLLGGLLFGGLGHGFGVGLLDLLLIAGGILLLVSFLRRRQAAPAYAGPLPSPSRAPVEAEVPVGVGASAATAVERSDLDRGLGHVRTMDAAFDAEAFATVAREAFMDVQRAVGARDLAAVRNRLTPEMYAVLQAQCDQLRGARQTNRMEQIRIERAEVTEAWQESGWDFVTVMLAGAMLDYTVSDTTGAAVQGSSTTPAAFEEFWTFTRPVGPNAWKLTAIQTG